MESSFIDVWSGNQLMLLLIFKAFLIKDCTRISVSTVSPSCFLLGLIHFFSGQTNFKGTFVLQMILMVVMVLMTKILKLMVLTLLSFDIYIQTYRRN